jgi:LysR family hydrogen peroxide-inducible transcriptional activator
MSTLSQLEYVVAVDRLRHFAKAAAVCFVSQPSLSMQIRKVEREIGFALFDRRKKPVLPTAKGLIFLAQAKVVLREHQHLIHLTKSNEKEVSGEFRLGVIPTLSSTTIPAFIAPFIKRYPKVKLFIDERKTAELISGLREDSLDAGLLSTPLNEQGISEHVLFREDFFLYVNPRHPLSKRKVLAISDLEESHMWLLEDGHCFKNQVVRFCSLIQGAGAIPNVHFEGGSLETLRQLVKQTSTFTLIPELFMRRLPSREQTTMVRPFRAPAPHRDVSLVFRRDHWKREIVTALEQSILESLPDSLRSTRMNLTNTQGRRTQSKTQALQP